MTAKNPEAPEPSHALRMFAFAALGAVVGAGIGAATLIATTATSLFAVSVGATVLAPFAAWSLVRVVGGLLTRWSQRTSVIALGDVIAFALIVIAAAIVGGSADSSGSVGLALAIILPVGIPSVAILSLVSSAIMRSRIAIRILGSIAVIIGLTAVITMFGTSYWTPSG